MVRSALDVQEKSEITATCVATLDLPQGKRICSSVKLSLPMLLLTRRQAWQKVVFKLDQDWASGPV